MQKEEKLIIAKKIPFSILWPESYSKVVIQLKDLNFSVFLLFEWKLPSD